MHLIKLSYRNMKTIYFGILAMTFLSPCIAQITLDMEDLPQPGNIQISVKIDSTQGANLSPGSPGTNMVWDYSMLNPCCGSLQASYDTVTWINHSSTPKAGDFPLSNIARKDRCYIYHSHVTHTEATACYNNHYIVNNTGLFQYGFEDPVPVVVGTNWNIFPLLAYGDSTENVAHIQTPISADTVRVNHIISKSLADGWGTLITPDTTVQVIRITTTEKMYDTLYVNNVATDIHVYLDNYYYRWYSKKTGFPILEINKGFQNQKPPFSQKVKYSAYRYFSLGISESKLSGGIHIFPNPFTSAVTFQIDEGRIVLSVTIYNSMGRKVITNENIRQNKIDINGEKLPVGIYFYTIVLNSNDTFSGRFIKL